MPDDQVVDANGVLNPNATFMWADDTDWEDAIQRTGSRTDIGVSVSPEVIISRIIIFPPVI